jgi:CRISPR-associated endoribonuclease Cas6
MRVRIVFALKNKGGAVPFHHQMLLSSFIQTQLAGGEQQDYTFYNFSGLKGQTKVSRVGLQFYSSKVTLVVSSLSKAWIDTLLRTIFAQTQVEIGNLLLIPERVELEMPPSFEFQMKYICISPMAVIGTDNEHYTAKKFISPEDDAFSDLLYEVLMKRMEQTGLYTTEQLANFYKFQVLPDKQYLQKIKADDKKFARIYTVQQDSQKHEFRAYTLPFTLYADATVQKFLFECGIGYHTEEGFGMIDYIQGDSPKSTVPYELEGVAQKIPFL